MPALLHNITPAKAREATEIAGTRIPIEPVELNPNRLFWTSIGLDEQKTGASSPSLCMAKQMSNVEREDESELATNVQ